MAEMKCCLIGVLDYFVLIITLVVSLGELLASKSISPVFVGIVVTIVPLLVGILCPVYCCDSECIDNDRFMNVIITCIRLWCSCVLGLMSFVDISAVQNNVMKAVTGMLLISIGIKAIWLIVQQYYGLIEYPSSTVTWTEMLQLVGFSVTGFVFLPKDLALFSKYALFLILVSFAFTLVALRLRVIPNSPFGISLMLLVFTVCQVEFFSTVNVPFYGVALGCFACRLFFEPVFEFFFSNISVLESMNSVFSYTGCLQKMFIMMVIVFEVIFSFHAGVSAIYHNEWYWILLFIGLFLFWIGLHSYFAHLCWEFSNKLLVCNKAEQNTNTTIDKMMAASGMRLHAQLAHFLIANTFGSTLLLGIVTLIPSGVPAWHKDEKAALAASCLIVLLVEGVFYAATDTLRKLPGACTACIIMQHTSSNRELWIAMMEFLERNAIPCCMYISLNGLTVQTLEHKLHLFFSQTIPDTNDQRYDSYVVFYCGDVSVDGKWELTGGTLMFGIMQKLWDSCNTDRFQSRLILIQDAKYSKNWLKKIAKHNKSIIAMQTYKLGNSRLWGEQKVGDFTSDWIMFNSPNGTVWQDSLMRTRPIYQVSQSWNVHEFHMPNEDDMEEYATNFPKILNSLIKILLFPDHFKEQTFCCTCSKGSKMNWAPLPHLIDTGHGFQLVRA